MKPFSYEEATQSTPDAAKPFSYEDATGKPPPGKGFLGHARDLGLAAARGAIAVPEVAVGAADILSGGRAGKALENQGGTVGFRPKQAKEFLSSLETDQTKAQRQEFADADGVLGKAGVALSNPSLIANTVTESAPTMLAGGLVGRGVKALGLAGSTAAAIGEGAVMAGSAAEQMRQQTDDGLLTGKQTALALGTGAVGAAVGAAGNRLGQAFGDADTMLVNGIGRAAGAATTPPTRGMVARVLGGSAAEGAEEVAQSVPEQMLQNAGLSRPLDEGVADAAVMGALAGGVMGAGAGVMSGRGATPAPTAQPGQEPAAQTAPEPQPLAPEPEPLATGFTPGAESEAAPESASAQASGENPTQQGQTELAQAATPENSDAHQRAADSSQSTSGNFSEQQQPFSQNASASSTPLNPSIVADQAAEAEAAKRANRLAAVGVADAQPNSPLTNAALAAVDSGAHGVAMAGAQSPSNTQPGAQPQPLQADQSASPPNAPIVAAPTLQERIAALSTEIASAKDATGKPLNRLQVNMRRTSMRQLIGELPADQIEAARAQYDAPPQELTRAADIATGPARVLQNRDRSTAASIGQMNKIASAPDYLRAGQASVMENGAPVVFGAAPERALVGKEVQITDGTGKRTPVQYAVVEAEDVLPSHQADGTPIAEYQNGIPGKLRAVAGNGRAAGISAGYQRGTAAQYRQDLTNDAEDLGIDPQAVSAMKAPVLVRVMPEELVTDDIGDRSNIGGTAALSPTEQAANDTRRIDLRDLTFDENGVPDQQSIAQFVQAMPEGERNMLQMPDGSPTRQGIDRITSAAFKAAYGNDDVVRLQAQSTDTEIRNIITAMARVAGPMAGLAGAGDFDIRGAVAEAAQMAVNAKRQGITLTDYLSNADMGFSGEAFTVARFMVENIRSAKNMAEGLRAWVDYAAEQVAIARANQVQDGMFGATPTASRGDTFNQLGVTSEQPSAAQINNGASRSSPAENRAPRQEAQPAAEQNRPADSQEKPAQQSRAEKVTPPEPAYVPQLQDARQETRPAPGAQDQQSQPPAAREGRAKEVKITPQSDAEQIANAIEYADNLGLTGATTDALPVVPGRPDDWRTNFNRGAFDALTAPTPQDILDQQARAEAAAQAEKAQQRAADERARLERERKDIAAASLKAADTFTLGGDAEQNLSGQQLVFDAPAGQAEAPMPAKQPNAPTPTENRIFTKDAADAARARLLAKRGRLNSGIDPEMLLDGITLAGYHIERGARTFAAYAKAMISDLGDDYKPYLKSWYMGVKFDPRAASFEGMDSSDYVENFKDGNIGKEVSASAWWNDIGSRERGRALSKIGVSNQAPDTAWSQLRSENRPKIEAYYASLNAPQAEDDAPESPATASTPAPGQTLTQSLAAAIESGNMPKDNPALKKLVEVFDGQPADQARMKQAQEGLETAIAMTARKVVAKNEGDRSTFDALLRMYESQPNLNVRTSTSIANQAYSTPAPLAFLASRLAGITNATVAHEPTAGTGMLLIGADPKKAIVNELNDLRIGALEAQGFTPTQKDAATQQLVPTGARVDAVITNPPFGSVKDDAGKPTKIKVDGFNIGQIDHLIAARALAAMKEDGKATLILGANKAAGGLSTDDRIFFNWLYANYNVTGHFEVSGDLYTRQGAGWPVRVISINGRMKSGKFSPVTGTIQRADNWSEVYEQFTQSLKASNAPISRTPDESGKNPASVVPTPASTGAGRPQGGTASAGNVSGASPRAVPDRAEPAAEPVGASADEQRLNAQSYIPEPQPGAKPAASARPAKPAGAVALDDAPKGNELQSPYTPRSARKDEGVLIPANMAQPTQDALSRLEDEVGDIDEFARKELGYKTVDELHNALMGLQVDSVATAIWQIKRGKAVVIADQTGIGKGRQAAAIIRWAAKQGMIPVFVSVKPSLFTDMYGDLADIGTSDISPFILNGDAWVAGEDGSKLFANKPATHKAALQQIANSGELPGDSNALFMTYSQINVENVQRRALMALAPNAVFVLDESHNAAGASATGQFMIDTLGMAKGVTYLSATYAKRPDNMPLYFKTDIGDAAADAEGLSEAMTAGGLPLQTVVSNNLVKAGQMFRRERSYDGVSIASTFDTPNRALHERMSNEATKALRAIVSADKLFHSIFVKNLSKTLAAEGSSMKDVAGNKASAGVQHTEFSSVVHNFVKQMLLGLKAQTAANEAIASLRRGEKPIIAVENTMGSFLNEYASANSIAQGESLGSFDYRTVLARALERTRVIVETDVRGVDTKRSVPLSELDFVTATAYRKAADVIDGLSLAIPVSPIDWMRAEISRAGFSVAEITGRNLSVDYSDPKKPVLAAIDQGEQKDKVNTTRLFNSGKLDALILNVAGSTGISLHASEKFEDQRQRHMIVAQAAGDINIFMQMLGRVHRTGQVKLPKYTILSVDLPTEKRPTAVLSVKMKSLNANTSSNTESATSVKTADILNKYGDQIVNQYLNDNYTLARALGLEEEIGGEDVQDDIARKATGRLALQPIETQHAFYDDVEAQYAGLIEYLNKTNQNDLEPRTFDFDAKETRQEVLFEGPDKSTPFGEDAIYGEYSIKAQGHPMKPEEIRAAMAESLRGLTPEQHVMALADPLKTKFDAYRKNLPEGVQQETASQALIDGQQFMQSHRIGSTFRVDINGEPFNAVVLNIRNSHKDAGNPFSLSKMQLTVAVNGALRSLTIPATQFKKIEVSTIAPFFKIEQLFKEQPPNQREIAKIVTGNLLAAYGELQSTRGTIITFTKQDGTSEQGILLPKLFDYSKNTRGDFRIATGEDVLKFLQKSKNKDIGRFGVMSRDGNVRVLPAGRGVRVQVPKSKLKGGKFFLDKGLIAAGGDFVSLGSFMTQAVYEPDAAVKVLDILMKKQALYALPSMADEAKEMIGEKPVFSRSQKTAPTRMTRSQIQAIADRIAANWRNAPEIIVAASMADPRIPQAARDEDQRQRAMGATGSPEGFVHAGKVYLLADQLTSPERVAQVLLHESLGHIGLQGVFGDGLKTILQQIATMRRADVTRKAEQYGLDMGNAADRLTAAEEVLAEMAQAQPEIGFVKRAVAAIRNWFRANMPGFRNLALTDADIVQAYILPARNFVGRGRAAGVGGDAAFSRGATSQTDTPEFKKWFGGSRVVDADGKPLVVYHGTKEPMREKFQVGDRSGYKGRASAGAYFTAQRDDAESYGPNLHEVYLSIKNPLIISEVENVGDYAGPPTSITSKKIAEYEAQGYDGIIYNWTDEDLGYMPFNEVVAFRPEQIKSATDNSGQFDPANPDIRFSRSPAADPSAPAWAAPEKSGWFDNMVYATQDKQIDTKRVVEAIRTTSGELADALDARLQESLYHGRAAARSEDFVNKELGPLVNAMRMRGLDIAALDEYLHARHAEEANALIAQRNPDIPDGGSGMTTADARAYLAGLDAGQRAKLEAVAAQVDTILARTRQLYADYSLESQKTIDGWSTMFAHYVPLMREDDGGGVGIGQGFSIKGRETRSRTGSTRKVVDILANIAMQRERAIVRGEKNRVATALVGLAEANPNKEFWHTGPPPSEKVYDAKLDKVVSRPDPLYKSRENVLMAKIKKADGTVVEKAVVFSENNERAMRMATALKNLDAAHLEGLLGVSGMVTRYFAKVNTQLNPIFGVVNLVRDVQSAILNLTSTALKGKGAQVASHVLSALKGVYQDARAARNGQTPRSPWADLWEEFRQEGGQTGFRDAFTDSNDRANAIRRELNPEAWMDSPLGKIFTAGGALKVPLAIAQKRATGLFGWLSDYNLAMENAVRLSAYKVAREQGMSKQQAASLAKELTVNFNRKGQIGSQAGALYAFFNASMQGTARLGETLFAMEPGKPKTLRLSATGRNIVLGGVTLGVMQALLLSAAGFDDEEPPDFVRERSLIVPTGWLAGPDKGYITIPMPLGLHVLPNMGRIPTEFALNGFKNPEEQVAKLLTLITGAFNPIGGGKSLLQTLAPTPIDPLAALAENKDWTGKPIARTSRNPATPGHLLTKDTASYPAKVLAEAINVMTGGTEYVAGILSPTPDQIDYLWSQATGGVGREVSKAQQSASAVYSGEDLPIHKIPLAGRFFGDTDTPSAQSNKFYSAIDRLNRHEEQIKGLRKDGRGAEVVSYLAQNPEARLFIAANAAERQVQELRGVKRDLIKKDAPAERVKLIEAQIASRMTAFNELMQRTAK